MKTWLQIFILPFLFSSAIAQVYPDVEKRGTPVTSFDQLQGDWTCIMKNRFMIMEDVESDVHLNNRRVKGDTAWFFEYPCRYYGTSVINTDSISKLSSAFENLRFLHDTLVVFTEQGTMGGYRFYKRDTFDQKIIETLIKDTIYPPALFGKWYLETQRCMDYSGEPPWRVHYPVYMPPIYKFDKSGMVDKRTILININGTLQKFRIYRWSLDEGYIELEPTGWRKKFRVIYFDRYPTHDECGNPVIYR